MRYPSLAVMFLALSLQAGADPAPVSEPPRAAYAAHASVDLHRVLQGNDFNRQESSVSPQWKHHWDWPKSTNDKPKDWSALKHVMQLIGDVMAFLLGHGLWILLAILLVLAWRYHRLWLPLLKVGPRSGKATRHPAVWLLPENEALTAPLPVDIASAAETCWRAGQHRVALSLLYRGALASLQRGGMVSLSDSATERENLASVRAHNTDAVEDFARIVRAWQDIAYAGRQTEHFDSLIACFRQRFMHSRAAS